MLASPGLQRHAELGATATCTTRNDALKDVEGRRMLMEPLCGNVLTGYTVPNVRDGFWKLYNKLIGADERRQPVQVEVDGGIDVLQAYFDTSAQPLNFKVTPLRQQPRRLGHADQRELRTASAGPCRLMAEGTGAMIASSTLPALCAR